MGAERIPFEVPDRDVSDSKESQTESFFFRRKRKKKRKRRKRKWRVLKITIFLFPVVVSIFLTHFPAWLVHGAEKLGNALFTNLSPHYADPRWFTFLVSNLMLSNLPRVSFITKRFYFKETRVCLTIWARPASDVSSPTETIMSINKNDIPLGWANMNLFDYEVSSFPHVEIYF